MRVEEEKIEENDFENNRVEDVLNEKVVIYKGHLAIEYFFQVD